MMVFNSNIETKNITVKPGGLLSLTLDTTTVESKAAVLVREYPNVSFELPTNIDGGIIFT